jgi:PleD family two-component response regulator
MQPEPRPASGLKITATRSESSEPGNYMKKVLVADDKASNRELIRTLLEKFGHTVSEASDGIEALRPRV